MLWDSFHSLLTASSKPKRVATDSILNPAQSTILETLSNRETISKRVEMAITKQKRIIYCKTAINNQNKHLKNEKVRQQLINETMKRFHQQMDYELSPFFSPEVPLPVCPYARMPRHSEFSLVGFMQLESNFSSDDKGRPDRQQSQHSQNLETMKNKRPPWDTLGTLGE